MTAILKACRTTSLPEGNRKTTNQVAL